MRDLNDIRRLKLYQYSVVEIDLERVEQDPVWESVSRSFDLSDPSQFQDAIGAYVTDYLSRQGVLEDVPFTNGPATLIGSKVEMI